MRGWLEGRGGRGPLRRERFDLGAQRRGVITDALQQALGECQQLRVFPTRLLHVGAPLVEGQCNCNVEQVLQLLEPVDVHGPPQAPPRLAGR